MKTNKIMGLILSLSLAPASLFAAKGGKNASRGSTDSTNYCSGGGSIDQLAVVREVVQLAPNKIQVLVTPAAEAIQSVDATTKLRLMQGSANLTQGYYLGSDGSWDLMSSLMTAKGGMLALFDNMIGNTNPINSIPLRDVTLTLTGHFLPSTDYHISAMSYNGCMKGTKFSRPVSFKSLPKSSESEAPIFEKVIGFWSSGAEYTLADGSSSFYDNIGFRAYVSDNNAIKLLRLYVDGRLKGSQENKELRSFGISSNQPFQIHNELEPGEAVGLNLKNISDINSGIHRVRIEAVDFSGNIATHEFDHDFKHVKR